jgi:hypothetical protein
MDLDNRGPLAEKLEVKVADHLYSARVSGKTYLHETANCLLQP